ncbi:MAG: hypothetical protein RLZZ21_1911 [Planctomycetota bacterium]|jgi:hypothetical protein
MSIAASSPPAAPRRHVAWIGPTRSVELAWARDRVAASATVIEVARPADLAARVDPVAGPWPAIAVLASDMPSRWTAADAVAVSRCWPLTPVVSACTSLAEGRRRSGPPLPGVEEVAWNELPTRLAGWLADLDAGRPGVLGLPAASRREDRVLEAAARLGAAARWAGEPMRVAVAARHTIDLDGTSGLLAASGAAVVDRALGRPRLDVPARLVVWDVEQITAEVLTWLRMLTIQQPDLAVVLLDSFPRGDTCLAALDAGALAVLGRPLAVESLAGLLSSLKTPVPPAAGIAPLEL